MAMTDDQFDKLGRMSRRIVRMLNDADDDPAFTLTVLTYVNAGVIFSILGGKNPTKMLEELQIRVEEAYADICASAEEIADE